MSEFGREVLSMLRSIAMVFVMITGARADGLSSTGLTDACPNKKAYLESKTLWRGEIYEFIADRVVAQQAVKERNTQALYNLQVLLSNFLVMIRSCEDFELLNELVNLLRPTFETLEEDQRDGGRKWICRGGPTCTNSNRLLNKEVELYSLQYLALLSGVFSAIGQVPLEHRTKDMASFVRTAFDIIWFDHIARFASTEYIQSLAVRLSSEPYNAPRNGSSSYFLHDRDLWLLTTIAEFVGAAPRMDPERWRAIVSRRADFERVQTVFQQGMTLVRSRITLAKEQAITGGGVITGDLDRGMWRYHKDNRYAGYHGLDRPVVCTPVLDSVGKVKDYKKRILVEPGKVPIVDSGGWDLSHARRLVHFFNAIGRNGEAINRYLMKDFDTGSYREITRAFAAALISRVWNRDRQFPLFANYWDGTRGWYRVDFDVGVSGCSEGYSPFALSDAVPTGGFIFWAQFEPILGELGMRIFELSRSSLPEDVSFMKQWYPELALTASRTTRSLKLIQFLPSLVGLPVPK